MFPKKSDGELLQEIAQKNGVPGNSMNICLEELKLRFQQKLIKDTHSLTIATWVLAILTMLLTVVGLFR